MLPGAEPVREIQGADPRALPDAVLQSALPLVLRGVVAD
ncbi:cupin-like domain-containing protein, partial [Xanthomonas sp. Kuri4-1]